MGKTHYSDNWTDWDSEAASIGFDYDAIEKAVFCTPEKQEKCLSEYEQLDTKSIMPEMRRDSYCICIKHLVKQLLHYRLENPILFDYFCIKVCYPELSYEDILKVFRGLEHDGLQIEMRMIARHRARITEIDKRMGELARMQTFSMKQIIKELKQRIGKIERHARQKKS
jgi:hypothetical protein